MKLARMSLDMVLKIVYWICSSYVCWYENEDNLVGYIELPKERDV